jgi:hypothetical protein
MSLESLPARSINKKSNPKNMQHQLAEHIEKWNNVDNILRLKQTISSARMGGEFGASSVGNGSAVGDTAVAGPLDGRREERKGIFKGSRHFVFGEVQTTTTSTISSPHAGC